MVYRVHHFALKITLYLLLLLAFAITMPVGVTWLVIIPGLFEPPVRTLRATIPENKSHIFR